MIALLPFGYYWTTRLRSFRDLAYLVVTSWIPLPWLAHGEGPASLWQLLTAFALGYFAFISAYELGYLANDAWDARRHPDGRDRGSLGLGWNWVLVFVTIRIACWAGIGVATGWLQLPLWCAAYLTLAVVFLAHNILPSPSLRLATFAQLAVLRFVLPLAATVSDRTLTAIFVAAVLAYVPLRYLSYADSKGLLDLPQRRSPWFATGYLALTMPLLSLAAWQLHNPSLLAVGLFLVLAHAAWTFFAHQINGANP